MPIGQELGSAALSWLDLLVVLLAAVAGGALNALAGGGTFITFPVLTAVGLSPTVANITNTVALTPGYLGGTLAQRSDLQGQGRRVRIFLVVGVAGGFVGGFLLVSTKEKVFEILVPFLILGATVLLGFQDRIRGWVARRTLRREDPPADISLLALVLVFLASVYGGYFGAGLGIILLGVIGIGISDTLTRVNALKQSTSFCVNISAAMFFLFSGHVEWSAAVLMAAGALIGGTIGGRIAGRMSPVYLRRTVVGFGLAVSALFFVRLM
jgi:uncharacterized membrane protein YfcA